MNENPKSEPLRSGSLVRWPFRLTIHDDAGAHEIGPLWIDVPEAEIEAGIPDDYPGRHWELVSRIERYAADRIRADVECSIDITNLGTTPPNNPVRNAGEKKENHET